MEKLTKQFLLDRGFKLVGGEYGGAYIMRNPDKSSCDEIEVLLDDVDNKFIRMRETKPKDISEFLNRLTTVEQEFLWEHIEKVKKLDREEREQKPTWSEEDEQMIESIIQLLYDTKSENCWNCIFIKIKDKRKEITFTSIEKWLKSLKNRIQPKQGEHDSIEEPNFFDDFRKTDSEVEPKFKAGDWIVFNGFTLYIKEVVKGYYRTISKGGIVNSHDWNIDNVARLWTIEDAKDGDVLVKDIRYPFESSICLFKKLNSHIFTVRLYCSINDNGQFLHNYDAYYHRYDVTVYPATKEQRDLLFQKMREEGYEWDAEKKELKEILMK